MDCVFRTKSCISRLKETDKQIDVHSKSPSWSDSRLRYREIGDPTVSGAGSGFPGNHPWITKKTWTGRSNAQLRSGRRSERKYSGGPPLPQVDEPRPRPVPVQQDADPGLRSWEGPFSDFLPFNLALVPCCGVSVFPVVRTSEWNTDVPCLTCRRLAYAGERYIHSGCRQRDDGMG